MPRRIESLAASLALLAASAAAQETGDTPKSALRTFMRDAIKAKLLDQPSAPTSPPVESTAGNTVIMAPFVVRAKRAPNLAGIDTAMQKAKELESHALYHTDLSKKVRMEVGLPPGPGGKGGGFTLPLLRLSW